MTFVEGLLIGLFGLAEALNLDSDRLVMGVTTGLFCVAYGVGLIACAWGLHTVRPWSRGPVLLAQLISLGLAVLAVVVLGGLLHPRTIEALERAAE